MNPNKLIENRFQKQGLNIEVTSFGQMPETEIYSICALVRIKGILTPIHGKGYKISDAYEDLLRCYSNEVKREISKPYILDCMAEIAGCFSLNN
jgi:hypothetical protein